VYHINIEKLTILDKGGDAVNLPSAAPPTPSKRARDPAADSAFDDLSPSKKLTLLINLLFLPHCSLRITVLQRVLSYDQANSVLFKCELKWLKTKNW
jgi:hypothetical protein